LIEWLLLFLVLLGELNAGDLSLNILLQVVALALLPPVTVALNGSKSEKFLIWGELTVLAHCIEAADKLHLLGLVRLGFSLDTLELSWNELLSISFGVLLSGNLLLLVSSLLLGEDLVLLVDSQLISNTGLKSLLKETSLILKADSHV